MGRCPSGIPANHNPYHHHHHQDLMAALALEPNNTSISAELETVKSHIQDKATSENASLPAAEAPLSTSTASSDSETSSANQPTAGPSSSAVVLDGRSSNNLMKEVSTKRFTSSHPKTISSNLAPGGTSFGDLKQIRQKKEEKSSGLMSSRIHITRVEAEKMRKSSPSSTNSAIPPIKSFSDFEMRWGMSSQPELRCSILETLDHHRVDQLFGEHLEPETLEQMIDAMQVSLKSNEKARIRKAVELLQGLDHVPRIGTLTMFLESGHQKVIREILLTFENLEPGKYIKLNNWNI